MIDQYDPVYDKKINSWVEKGARNYIEIKPKTNLNIVELKVMVNDK